jgi:hypothetical protein
MSPAIPGAHAVGSLCPHQLSGPRQTEKPGTRPDPFSAPLGGQGPVGPTRLRALSATSWPVATAIPRG